MPKIVKVKSTSKMNDLPLAVTKEYAETQNTLTDAKLKLACLCDKYPAFLTDFQLNVEQVYLHIQWAEINALRLIDTSTSIEAVDAFQHAFNKALLSLSELNFIKILDELIKAKQD